MYFDRYIEDDESDNRPSEEQLKSLLAEIDAINALREKKSSEP